MSYAHTSYEVSLVPGIPVSGAHPTALQNGINLAVTAISTWGPGYMPHIIRGAAVLPLVTTTMTDAIGCRFEADISAAGTPTHLFTISIPTTRGAHKVVYYKPTYVIKINPGQLVEMHCTTAATAGVYAKVVLYVEPSWEDPSNLTGMLRTT